MGRDHKYHARQMEGLAWRNFGRQRRRTDDWAANRLINLVSRRACLPCQFRQHLTQRSGVHDALRKIQPPDRVLAHQVAAFGVDADDAPGAARRTKQPRRIKLDRVGVVVVHVTDRALFRFEQRIGFDGKIACT